MPLQVDWELENWLLESGERADQKAISGGLLSPSERLIREFWLLDIHTRNGGVSQYFCDFEQARWLALRSAWLPDLVPSLGLILAEVDRVIEGACDPYVATLSASPGIDEFYESHQLNVVRELRQLDQPE